MIWLVANGSKRGLVLLRYLEIVNTFQMMESGHCRSSG